MKIPNIACVATVLLASLSIAKAGGTTTLASWKFDGQSHAAPYNSPAATTGAGTAAVIGMATNYNGIATTANADLFATNGASTGAGSVAWRIQATPNIGWSTNAPIGSQGVQFKASSVGYYQVKARFDVYATNGAESKLLVQYNFDNGTNWYNAANLTSAGAATIKTNTTLNNGLVVGSYVSLVSGWNNNITADLSGIAGLANNTNIQIRLVNAATGTNCLTVSGTNYNNTSGYWGLDNVTITAVSFDVAAQWTFESYAPVGAGVWNTNPIPEFGSGQAIALGFDNNYIEVSGTGSTNASDVMGQGGSSSNPSGSGFGTNCWRVRGLPNNGWNSAAPIGTQGAEFDVPTTSYTNILLSFDIYFTTQGEAKMCVQYTTDDSTWVTASNIAFAGNVNYITNNPVNGSPNTVVGNYFFQTKGQNWYNNIVVDLTGVTEVNKNPNFKFRIVNAATGADCVTFQNGSYNNNSGNCRFDNVTVVGQYAGIPSPALVADPNATVDTYFTNTFTDNPAWRAAITGIYVNGSLLSSTAYSITAGLIVYNPTNSVLLQSSGSKFISILSAGYAEAKVTQPLATGVAVKLALTTQPAAPSASGGTLVANPALAVTDKWGNGTATAPNTNVFVTASVGGGVNTWTLGGSTNQSSVGGYMVFSNLTATVTGLTNVSGAYITFTVSNYNGIGSVAIVTNSSLFKIGAPPTSFVPGNLAVLQLDTASSVNTTFSVIEVNASQAGQTAPVSVTPISATGTNALRLANTGTIGRLSLSSDGTLLCFAAFADDNSANPDETLNLSRAAGTLNYTNLFAKPVSYTSTSTGGSQARSCTTVDNVNFLIDDKAFLYYGVGNSGYTVDNNNNVVVRAFGGNYYVETQKSSAADPRNALFGIDVSDPSSPVINSSLGYPLGVDGNAQDFYMISTNGGVTFDILYILDATKTAGIINKYSLVADGSSPNGYSWTSNGSYTNTDGADSLFATTNGNGGVYLYYTTAPTNSANNSVVRVTDASGFNAPLNITSTNVLYTATGGAYLKGVTFVPCQFAEKQLTPSPVLLAAVGAQPNTAFTIALSPEDSVWRAAITNIMVNGSTLPPIAYDATQPGQITFNPAQSALLQGATSFAIVVKATGYSAGTVVQAINQLTPPLLNSVALSGGKLAFSFTNSSGLSFSVLATNNLTAPKSTWPVIGTSVENPAGSGNYQFIDTNTATNATRYYLLRQP